MVEALEQRRECGFDVGEIHYPSRFHTGFAFDMDFDAERMPMQARAFVSCRHIGQPVRGFDLECLENMHCAIVYSSRNLRSAAANSEYNPRSSPEIAPP